MEDDDNFIPTIAEVVGANLRQIRETRSLRQDDVAGLVQAAGLGWGRSTVAALEAGSKVIELGELLILAGAVEVDLGDLLAGAGPVQIGPRATADLGSVSRVLAGKAEPRELLPERQVVDDRGRAVKVVDAYMPRREAEQKAARRFGVSVDEVVEMARQRWGRSLTEERDARVAEMLRVVPTSTGGVEAGRRRYRSEQGLRGHVTRALLAELEPFVEKGD